MGDLLESLKNLILFVVWWLNLGQYRLERDQGSPVEGVKPYLRGVLHLKCDQTVCSPIVASYRYNERADSFVQIFAYSPLVAIVRH